MIFEVQESIGFEHLSDDDLIKHIRAAIAEAVRRGGYMAESARSEYEDGIERARIAVAAAEARKEAEHARAIREAEADASRQAANAAREAEAARINRSWAIKKGDAEAVRALLEDAGYEASDIAEVTIAAWKSGADRRIYITGERRINLVSYYVEGSRKYPPGTIEVSRRLGAHKDRAAAICRALSAQWLEVRFHLLSAAKWDGESVALPVEGQ